MAPAFFWGNMHFLILLIFLVLLIYGPQWWVQRVLSHYNRQDETFPGSGGELARHLLDRFNLDSIKVEIAEGTVGDHYDPIEKAVRLTVDKFEGHTLTAITTAAHEVGHAIQHGMDYTPFLWRMRLARIATISEKIGSFLLFVVPLLTLITRTPAAGLIIFIAAMATVGASILLQLLTLPVEWDASFRRALPILESYIDKEQIPPARRILRACALTYFAGSLAGLLNFWRWMRLFRH